MHKRLCVLILLTVIYFSAFLNRKAHAYSQVYQSHRNSKNFSSPKIFKALNSDLLFPAANLKQVNETAEFYVTPMAIDIENQTTTASTLNIAQPSSSGRAIYTQPLSNLGPFLKSIKNRPSTPISIYRSKASNSAELENIHNKDGFNDRFSPSEAVASNMLRKKNKNQYMQNGAAAASNNVPSYVKPIDDIYSFPPNTDSKYPLPPVPNTRGLLLDGNISQLSSYLPPPSGLLHQYDPIYAATENKQNENNNTAMDQNAQNNNPNMPMEGYSNAYDKYPEEPIGVLPASAMDQDPLKNQQNIPLEHFPHPHEDEEEYATPPPGWKDDEEEQVPPPSSNNQYSPYHSHHHDHPHHIIYDDFPHHHQYYHHDQIEALPPRNPPLPPSSPEPPPEPRVKKYSYFYIGRKLWYIPLYFTVWFSFYVLWLILKSIARHKVNLPNHYTARRSIRSDFGASETLTHEFINKLTISVLNGIEQFKSNHIT